MGALGLARAGLPPGLVMGLRKAGLAGAGLPVAGLPADFFDAAKAGVGAGKAAVGFKAAFAMGLGAGAL